MSDRMLVAPRPVDARPWTVTTPSARKQHALAAIGTTFADTLGATWTPAAMSTGCDANGTDGRPTIARPAPGLLGDVT